MKVNGREIKGTNEDFIVFPRAGEDEDIIFKGKALKSYEEFNEAVRAPVVPVILTRNGKEDDLNDVDYNQALALYAKAKIGWIVMKTLEPSNIEWEKIDPEKSSTWGLWTEEFENSGLTSIEQEKLVTFVLNLNLLNPGNMEAAKEAFLRGRTQE